jgi:hypothetical protein
MTLHSLLADIIAVAAHDPRIVGVIDYGSMSEGRADAWSDLDLALFIRASDVAAFEAAWQAWVAQFGPVLLAYIGGVGHPWVVYDTIPIPTRVDFAFHRESDSAHILTWPNAPVSVDAMVRHDATGGVLTQHAARMVGQSLHPQDPAHAFTQAAGDFWYYTLRTWSKAQRGQWWAVRYDFNAIMLGNLLALLRLEVGATERWRSSAAAVAIEQVVSPERLAQLDQCIPGRSTAELQEALYHAAQFGQQVCQLPKPKGLGLVPGATSSAGIRDVWRIDGRPTGNSASRDHICKASEPA